ncbi:MAG: Uma2 family endonuclease [Leptospiraceae bacterium]|nr:Uma2 family endonuclease [Leptospiraceae bacterium]
MNKKTLTFHKNSLILRDMNTVELQFPKGILFTPKNIEEMVSLNPGLSLQFTDSGVTISEGDMRFSNMDFFKLLLPFKMQEEDLHRIGELNQHLKLEGEEKGIIVNMGTTILIGAFTAAILITVGVWNRKMKLGRVADSSTGHDMQTEEGKKHRIPDVSFIAYKKFTSKVLDSNSRVGSPTLCIEVVSNRDSLNQDLEKMEEDWIQGGTEIGLVVCPHRKKYYIFESGQKDYKTLSFSKPFTHKLLPELILDFDALLQEAMEECC